MLDILQSILLGALQGLTEWLPVSSSGHLVLAQNLMGLQMPAAFDAALHIGTLLPVLWLFRREIWGLKKGFFTFDRKNPEFRSCIFLLISTLITGVIGVAFLKFFESLFTSPAAVGTGLILTAGFLAASKFFNGKREIGAKDSVLIGAVQALAIAPGLSRSGSTISTALALGIEKRKAVAYSFLLAIPAVIGAQVAEFNNLSLAGIDPAVLSAGVLAAAVVGYISIRLLQKVVLTDRFHWFAPYCFLLGALVLYLAII